MIFFPFRSNDFYSTVKFLFDRADEQGRWECLLSDVKINNSWSFDLK